MNEKKIELFPNLASPVQRTLVGSPGHFAAAGVYPSDDDCRGRGKNCDRDSECCGSMSCSTVFIPTDRTTCQ